MDKCIEKYIKEESEKYNFFKSKQPLKAKHIENKYIEQRNKAWDIYVGR